MTVTTSFAPRRLAQAATIAVFCSLALSMPVSSHAATAPQDGATSLFGNYLAARHAVGQRDTAAAADFYRKALLQDPNNPVILERAFLLQLSNGDTQEASVLAERLIKMDPEHRIARLTLGVRAMRARQFAAARRHFKQAVERGGPVAELTSAFMVAWSHQGAGETDAALKILDAVQGAEWFQIYRAYHAGLIAELAGRDKIAQARFAEAYKLDSTALRIVESYARFLGRKGKNEEAREVLAAFEKLSPNHPMMRAVREDLDAGRLPDPVVKSATAGAAEGLYSIGAALGREGGEDLSVVYMQMALHMAPDAWLPLLSLADVYEAQKSYDKAVAVYEKVPATSPLKRNAEIQRAMDLNAMDRIDDAIAVLEKLIEADGADIAAITSLGNVLRANERFDKAAEVYSRAIGQIDAGDSRQWSLFYFRGICYERSKQWPKAEADLVKALELNPKEAVILNYLGYSWIDQGIHLDRAMEMIKQAVEAKPNDGYIVDSLGWAYYRIGDFEQAVRELERAVELRPEDPVINDHLGDAYWRAGRKLEATFQWSHARDLKPEPAELIKIEAKLKGGLSAVPIDRAAAEKIQNNGG